MTLKISMKTRPINMQPMKTVLIASALDIENDAKDRITINKNVVTGRLRGSITYALNDFVSPVNEKYGDPASQSDAVSAPLGDMVAKVGTNVEYAPHIEYGTEYAGQGGVWAFLRPAFIGQVNNIKERFRKALREAING